MNGWRQKCIKKEEGDVKVRNEKRKIDKCKTCDKSIKHLKICHIIHHYDGWKCLLVK